MSYKDLLVSKNLKREYVRIGEVFLAVFLSQNQSCEISCGDDTPFLKNSKRALYGHFMISFMIR